MLALRRIALGALLFVALGGGSYWLGSTLYFGSATFQTRLTSALTEYADRPVRLRSLRFGPMPPTLDLSGLEVAASAAAPPVLAIRDTRLELSAVALLTGRVVVRSVLAEGAALKISSSTADFPESSSERSTSRRGSILFAPSIIRVVDGLAIVEGRSAS